MTPPYRTSAPIVATALQGSVSNSVADSQILAVNLPPNALVGSAASFVGQAYIFEVWGNSDNTLTPVLNAWIKLGGTKLATLSWTMAATGQTNKAWWARFMVTCRSTGASGTVIAAGIGYHSGAAFAAGAFPIVSNTATTTKDTTTALGFSLGVNWGTASASNIARMDHAYAIMVAGGQASVI